jgi:hypothetical protein
MNNKLIKYSLILPILGLGLTAQLVFAISNPTISSIIPDHVISGLDYSDGVLSGTEFDSGITVFLCSDPACNEPISCVADYQNSTTIDITSCPTSNLGIGDYYIFVLNLDTGNYVSQTPIFQILENTTPPPAPFQLGLTSASTTELLAQAKDVVSGSWLLLILFVGIPLGFYLVVKLIGLMPKK